MYPLLAAQATAEMFRHLGAAFIMLFVVWLVVGGHRRQPPKKRF